MGKPKWTKILKTLHNQHYPNTQMAMEMGLGLAIAVHSSWIEFEQKVQSCGTSTSPTFQRQCAMLLMPRLSWPITYYV
jgi:hypothetical protein